jgi:hypothetical protein
MASKRFKNKPCAYCGRTDVPTEQEHILARSFVLKGSHVGPWPSAPACRSCNKDKANLEHYVTAVAPFGGRHRDARVNLEQNERRLVKNQKLARSLNMRPADGWVKHDGMWVRPSEVEFDWEKLGALCAYLAKGLARHHWGVVVGGEDCFVDVHLPLVGIARANYEKLRRARTGAERIAGSIGGDTFVYAGAQAETNPRITVWEMKLYGGLRQLGDPDGLIGVMTGPRAIRDMADLTARWHKGTRLHG